MPKKSKSAKGSGVQPEVNIGLIGHVDHGKTTLTERLSGFWTDTHSEEVKRGITIRLGYANSAFYKYKGEDGSDMYTVHPDEHKDAKFVRAVSLVDAPGHESLMATMLAGATIMDGALLLVSAAESCPQPQTIEHLKALEIMGVENIIIVQNKIDLVQKEQAQANYEQIKEFLKGTKYENSPIIPISAQHNINISYLISAIEEHIPTPKRDEKLDPHMFVARSFDINKPGSDIQKMIGGVLGGALVQGTFNVGDEIEIRPGQEVEEKNQKVYYPVKTKVMGIMSGRETIEKAGPGGSIALQTQLDPAIVKSDKLTGNVVGKAGTLPPVWQELKLKTELFERVFGAKDELAVEGMKKGEFLMLNVNAAATVGMVMDLGKNKIHCKLKLPVCAEKGSRVTISRMIANRFRLIGYGLIE